VALHNFLIETIDTGVVRMKRYFTRAGAIGFIVLGIGIFTAPLFAAPLQDNITTPYHQSIHYYYRNII